MNDGQAADSSVEAHPGRFVGTPRGPRGETRGGHRIASRRTPHHSLNDYCVPSALFNTPHYTATEFLSSFIRMYGLSLFLYTSGGTVPPGDDKK